MEPAVSGIRLDNVAVCRTRQALKQPSAHTRADGDVRSRPRGRLGAAPSRHQALEGDGARDGELALLEFDATPEDEFDALIERQAQEGGRG